MPFSIDAMTEFPQHRGPESIDFVWNYLEITITLNHIGFGMILRRSNDTSPGEL